MEQQQQWHSSKNIVWLINPGNPTDKQFLDMLNTSGNQKNSKNLEDGSGGGCADGSGSSTTSSDESRKLAIQRSLQSLAHASQCRDISCRVTSCHKMKRVLQHIKRCKCRSNKEGAQPTTGCPICKQLISLCCYHAKQCTENKCSVPHCVNIKFKLRQQQLLKRLQQIQILNRRSPLMTGMSQQSSQHDYNPSTQQLPQSTQTNNPYVKGKPMHHFQQQQLIQQQILERRIALMASLSKHSSQSQTSQQTVPEQDYMKPATPPPTDAARVQEVVARDHQQSQPTQVNNPYEKSEPVHKFQQQQSLRPTINSNQQKMHSNVTLQRYWTQNASEEKPQRAPLTGSAPQLRLTSPAFQTQRPPIPSDILLSQQQLDFRAQQLQQQELPPEDQLSIIIENL